MNDEDQLGITEAPAGRPITSCRHDRGISFRASRTKVGADDAHEWGPRLPYPMCGCCKAEIEIRVEKGPPERVGGKLYHPTIEIVIRPCDCAELRSCVACLLCTRCPNHCECLVPYLEDRR